MNLLPISKKPKVYKRFKEKSFWPHCSENPVIAIHLFDQDCFVPCNEQDRNEVETDC